MPTATINVKWKNARQDRKPPNVKTADNVIYSMNDQLAATIEQGKTYYIEYHITKSTDGQREFKILDKATEVFSAPASTAGSSSKKYGQVDDPTAERIFVCGAVNSCLSNPGEAIKFYMDDAAHGVALVNYWRGVWGRTFGNKPTVADEMDEIPL